MEKKGIDRRIQRTRQLLLDSLVALILEKGYEAITVQDIIDRANVGRSTFYAHFMDKEDLFISGFESLRSEFDRHINSQGETMDDPWMLSLIIFRHVGENQRLFKALVGKQGGTMMQVHFNKYLAVLIQKHINTQMPDHAREKIPPDLMTLCVVNTLMTLMIWWLNNNLPYSAEKMNEIYQTLTRPTMEALFQQG
jgi:AcrR family transcriptional regulator